MRIPIVCLDQNLRQYLATFTTPNEPARVRIGRALGGMARNDPRLFTKNLTAHSRPYLTGNDTIDRISIMSSQNSSAIQTEIFQAAQVLMQNRAVSFTMDALAEQTGLSRATIYRQVGSKKALLQQLAQEHGLPNLNQPDARSRILQAARTLFGQYGLMAPTMEQIASEAGVGVATVYRQFGDRLTLLKNFVETFQPRLPSDEAESTGDLTHDLIQLVQSMIQFIVQNQDMVRLSFAHGTELQAMLTEIRPFQERTLVRVAAFLQNHITAGNLQPIDPQQAAIALLGMILSFSLIMPTYYQLPEPDPQETAVFIVRLFLDGLRKDPKGLPSKD